MDTTRPMSIGWSPGSAPPPIPPISCCICIAWRSAFGFIIWRTTSGLDSICRAPVKPHDGASKGTFADVHAMSRQCVLQHRTCRSPGLACTAACIWGLELIMASCRAKPRRIKHGTPSQLL